MKETVIAELILLMLSFIPHQYTKRQQSAAANTKLTPNNTLISIKKRSVTCSTFPTLSKKFVPLGLTLKVIKRQCIKV